MMSTFQVRVLYDFDGEPNTAELSITAGETLTVTRNDVGEGWWEGLNSAGVSGLFPESYVEKIASSQPTASTQSAMPIASTQSAMPVASSQSAIPVFQQNRPVYGNDWDTFAQDSADRDSDDDWDETYSEIPTRPDQPYTNEPVKYRYQNDPDTISESNMSIDSKGTVTKKSLNRFTTFVKSGGESYTLGELKINVPDDKRIVISKLDENTFCWPYLTDSYTVHITSPKKETKLKGLKSFIAYQLTPSFNQVKVSRRYKHFDWLHERLTEKFSIIAIPPLPDKQISGRYEDQFIEHRRLQLQEFIDYVCKHPVLSTSDVWQHFLTCTDEKLWKQGKRHAERDILVGVNLCLSLQAPEKELMSSVVETKIDSSFQFIHNLDAAIKSLLILATDQSKKDQGPYKREHIRIGESFNRLGMALTSEEKSNIGKLPQAIIDVGTAYFEIARYLEEQPKMDWEPLANRLYLYKGLTSDFPEIFAINKGAQQKRRECEKNNMPPAELHEVRRRTDVLTYAIFAEMNHFKQQRDKDFKQAMQAFVTEQINLYRKVINRLEQTLEFINNV